MPPMPQSEERTPLVRQLQEANRLLEERRRQLESANEELRRHRDELHHEQTLAKQLFARVVRPGSLEVPGLRYLLSPMEETGGDLLLTAGRPGGGRYLLLGDFTGHGLTAAIGAIPSPISSTA